MTSKTSERAANAVQSKKAAIVKSMTGLNAGIAAL